MKTIALLLILSLGSYAQAHSNSLTCTGYYGEGIQALQQQQAIPFSQAVKDGKKSGDDNLTLSMSGGWPSLKETKSGADVGITTELANNNMRIFVTENAVPAAVIVCVVNHGGF